MPPKRKAATPPPKKSTKSKAGQTSIDNFFASPSKPKSEKKRSTSVISFVDSDDELPAQDGITGGDDEKVARELQQKFDTEQIPTSPDKGKAKQVVLEEDDEDGIEIVKEEVHVKKEGINGSSSSKVHPMFAPPSDVKTPTKPKNGLEATVKAEPGTVNGSENGSPAKITTSSAEAVDPIDFDVDQFLFRPAEIDISKWPKGRLPYSVLVGVYVQVSSTRSRLLIVRVLTKYVYQTVVPRACTLTPVSYISSYTPRQST